MALPFTPCFFCRGTMIFDGGFTTGLFLSHPECMAYGKNFLLYAISHLS